MFSSRNIAARLTLIYMLAGLVWVLVGEWLVHAFFEPHLGRSAVQVIKGIAFVLGTGALIYFVMNRLLRLRTKAEEEMATERDLARAVIDTMPGIFILTDKDGRPYMWNQRFQRLVGRSAEEIRKGHLAEFLYSAEETVRRWLINDGTSEESEVELKVRAVSGEGLVYSFHAVRMTLAGQFRVAVVGVDVSERYMAAESLRRRDAVLQATAFAAKRFLQTGDWRSSANEVLEQLGKAADVSRAYIYVRDQSRPHSSKVSLAMQWTAPGVSSEVGDPRLQQLDAAEVGLERWVKLMEAGEPVSAVVSELPEKEQTFFGFADVKAFVFVPVGKGEDLWGLVGLDECRTERRWDAAELDALHSIAQILRAAIQDQQRLEDWRASEERSRRLYESNPQPMCVCDRETLRFLAVNDAAERHYGYTQEEFLAMTLRDIVTEEEKEHFDEKVKVLFAGMDQAAVWYHRKKSGERFEAEIWSHAIGFEGNDAELILVRDVTRENVAQKALEESEALLKAFFDHSPLLMGVVSLYNDQLWMLTGNSATARFFGEEAGSELKDRDLASLLPTPQHAAMVKEKYQLAAREGRPVSFEYQETRDGLTNALRVLVAPIDPAGDDLPGGQRFCYLAEDITDRKKAEQRIREQAEMLNEAHDAIYVCNAEDKIEYWNRGAERIYGWTADEVMGQKPIEILTTDPASMKEAAERLEATGFWAGQLRQQNKSGEEVVVYSRWTQVRDGSRRRLVINTDETERRRLEEQFLRAQRLEGIGTLASGIAHDLNNILAPILMSAQVLRLDITDPHKLQILDDIVSSAQRGADVVKQVLTFARGVQGERLPVQAKHLVRELLRITTETFPRNIIIKEQIAPDLQLVLGDPTQLHQVLLNLAVNARDAMPHGGTLTFSGENREIDEAYSQMSSDARPGRYVMIEVADTGVGIPTDIQHRIFEPFFTTKELGQGTGLGLSTVLGIVRNHNGFIELESRVGEGSRFRVYLPASAEAPAPEAPAQAAEPPRGGGELILVVDDEQKILDIAADVLKANGYRVLTAREGTEALTIFVKPTEKVHAVVTDLMMPFFDGAALVRALRRIDPVLPIAVMTGLVTGQVESDLQRLGIRHFLRKPFHAGDLLAAVKALMESKRSNG